MADMMTFPNTVEEFMEQYKIVDTEKIYTNGAELVPIFRMMQWFEHVSATDTISRQAAIDAVEESRQLNHHQDGKAACAHEYEHRHFLKILKNLPSAQSEQRWIPCSERLPEKDGEYFTTLIDEEGAYVDVTEWQSILGGRWVTPFDECDYCEIGNVIAWMPLPEPYKGGETDEDD